MHHHALRRLATACAFLIVPSIANAAWTGATVSSEQALIRRQPNESAEVLGHLRQGKAIRVYVPERAGYYAINFGKQIKGTNIGWIAVGDVSVEGGGESAPPPPSGGGSQKRGRQKAGHDQVKPSWFDVNYELLNAAPSDFQTAIGDEIKGVPGTGFSLGYGHHSVGSLVGFQFEGFYYSMNGTAALTSGTYHAKGFGARAGLDLQFVNSSEFSVDMYFNVGMSINSAGNARSDVEFDTTNIMAFPMRVGLDLRKYFGGFGILAGAGFQISSLKEVPIVLQGNDASGNPNEGVADFNMSGMFFHFGVSIGFN